ncbi:universal stress protein [bacterium]|nr:MAG: universal stress protein [bacterium]
MTRILVGVDYNGTYGPTLDQIKRLRFPKPHLGLIHVATDRLPIPPVFKEVVGIREQFADAALHLAQSALAGATNRACGKGFPCEARLLHGNVAERLIEEAEKTRSDLVAVNATHHGFVGQSFIGSVSRALVLGSGASVLVTKDHRSPRAVFRAVFATDHSPFADRCLERFLQLMPEGIQEIHVVSAWQVDDREAAIFGKNLASLGGDADRWIEDGVKALNRDVCERLTEGGFLAFPYVRRGSTNTVIHDAMLDLKADLLVVGSQGHGAMTRDIVGSVSLHQTMAEPYPVLIVRPREA